MLDAHISGEKTHKYHTGSAGVYYSGTGFGSRKLSLVFLIFLLQEVVHFLRSISHLRA